MLRIRLKRCVFRKDFLGKQKGGKMSEGLEPRRRRGRKRFKEKKGIKAYVLETAAAGG